jgi:hypothetical protein
MKKFTTKDPVEKMILSFDFTDLFTTNTTESIISSTWEAKVKRGEDLNAQAMISNFEQDSNTVASCLVQGGLSGVIYIISCIVETSEGQVIKQSGILPVKTQG